MNKLSYLEKLLDGVEVEWLTAAEIFNIKNGYTPSKAKKEFWEDGNIPWFRLEDIRTNGRELNDSIMHVNQAGVKGNLFPKDSIFMSTTATIGEFALVKIPHLTNQQITNFSLTSRFKGIIDIRYLFHRFHHFGEWCKENANKSGGLSIIGIKKLSSYKFPIPCPDNPEKSLAIQAEIVRILDKFTALTAELTAELTMRKKQYNYYRDQLLSFKEGEVEWKALEEVSDIYDSLHQTPQYSKNGLSMIRVTDIKNGYIDLKNTLKVNDGIFSIFTKKYLPQKNDLVMSRVGSYGNVGIIPTDNSACMGQNTVVIHPHINNRYLFYILTSSIGQDFIEKNVGGGSQKTLSLKSIKSIPIPLTGESEQSKIVSILDKFDTLTTSISEGLPREIELRQKQYEYYRDLLFSFPKTETASN